MSACIAKLREAQQAQLEGPATATHQLGILGGAHAQQVAHEARRVLLAQRLQGSLLRGAAQHLGSLLQLAMRRQQLRSTQRVLRMQRSSSPGCGHIFTLQLA